MALTKAHNRMVENAPANVKDFGAVGDGVTNDTIAIQAALDASNNVFIPNGNYACGKLNLKGKIRGAKDAKITFTASGLSNVIELAGELDIDGVEFVKADGLGRWEPIPYNSYKAIISNCVFDGVQLGGYQSGSPETDDSGIGDFSVIERNIVKNVVDSGATDADGIHVNVVQSIQIRHNVVHDNDGEGIKVGGATAEYINVVFNECFNNGRNGIDLFNGGRNTICSFNTVYNNTGGGIEAKTVEASEDDTQSNRLVIQGNVVDEPTSAVGIDCYADRSIITGNLVEASVCIRSGGRDTVVADNICRAKSRGIEGRALIRGVISGNTIKLDSGDANNRPILLNPINSVNCEDVTLDNNHIDAGSYSDYCIYASSITGFVFVSGDNTFQNYNEDALSPVGLSDIGKIRAAETIRVSQVQTTTLNNTGDLSGITKTITPAYGEVFRFFFSGSITTTSGTKNLRLRIEPDGATAGDVINISLTGTEGGAFSFQGDLMFLNANTAIATYNGIIGSTSYVGSDTLSSTNIALDPDIKLFLSSSTTASPSLTINHARIEGHTIKETV